MINQSKTRKFARGFTLADMMVATAIIVTLSIFMVVNFKAGREKDELRNGGLLLVSLMHQAQSYTLAGKAAVDSGGGVFYPSGYGLLIDAANERVYLYGDDNTFLYEGTEPWFETYDLAEYNIQLDTVCVMFGAACEQNITSVDYLYTTPSGDRYINGSIYLPNQGKFSVIIRRPGLEGKGMVLSSDAVTGQVILGPIIDI